MVYSDPKKINGVKLFGASLVANFSSRFDFANKLLDKFEPETLIQIAERSTISRKTEYEIIRRLREIESYQMRLIDSFTKGKFSEVHIDSIFNSISDSSKKLDKFFEIISDSSISNKRKEKLVTYALEYLTSELSTNNNLLRLLTRVDINNSPIPPYVLLQFLKENNLSIDFSNNLSILPKILNRPEDQFYQLKIRFISDSSASDLVSISHEIVWFDCQNVSDMIRPIYDSDAYLKKILDSVQSLNDLISFAKVIDDSHSKLSPTPNDSITQFDKQYVVLISKILWKLSLSNDPITKQNADDINQLYASAFMKLNKISNTFPDEHFALPGYYSTLTNFVESMGSHIGMHLSQNGFELKR